MLNEIHHEKEEQMGGYGIVGMRMVCLQMEILAKEMNLSEECVYQIHREAKRKMKSLQSITADYS